MSSSSPLAKWNGVPLPSAEFLEGRYANLERLAPLRHADCLWQSFQGPDADPRLYDHVPYGPFAGRSEFDDWLNRMTIDDNWYAFAVIDRTGGGAGAARGIICLMSMAPEHGRIEIGRALYGASMQRSTLGTEAVYLVTKHCFDELGYRRVEWRCDADNVRSRRAAERLCFRYEFVLRRHMVFKCRNRDTVVHSIIDADWPRIKLAFDRWLSDDNQPPTGQVETLDQCRRRLLASVGH